MRTGATAIAALVLVLAACVGSAADAAPRTRVLKVFLADFEDVPAPERYPREYFDELFFGLGAPRATPEGGAISGSVREYFQNISEGRLDVEGEVADWVRIPRRITEIPHWKGGMKPFGESWPVIVAETLRAHGIVGEDAKEKLRLADGRMPELLVFLNTDWGTGGVNRGWGRLKEVLEIMKLGDLWDEAWTELPSPYSSYSATKWRKAPPSGPDGTIDQVPPEAELEMFPLSIMMHEMGHQLAGWPDLYGPAYEPWGVFDLMGGPAASTHFPMSVSAYLRVRSGWMQYTDMPRRTAPALDLRPLETHKVALRFGQGPRQESIVAENRWDLRYPRAYGEPPENRGPRLLLYRLDPGGRRPMMYGSAPRRKVTTHIRRPSHYGELWGEGEFTEVTGTTTPSSRNSLGELWWEFRNIQPEAGEAVRFDTRMAALDLIDGYRRATWTDGEGAAVEVGAYGSPAGHVAIRSEAGEDGEHRPALDIRTAPDGAIRGRYAAPEGGPMRLYVVMKAMEAPAVVTLGGTEARLEAGEERTMVVDIPAGASEVELEVRADEGQRAQVSVEEAWLVGMPAVVVDLLDAEGTVGVGGAAALHDGCKYGPRVLMAPLGGDGPKDWRGEWTVSVPEAGAVLRALVGLTADAPTGSKARVSLELVGPGKEWALMKDLAVEAHGPEGDGSYTTRSNLTAVVEAPVPKEAWGQECRLELEATTASEEAIAVALPCLRVCER